MEMNPHVEHILSRRVATGLATVYDADFLRGYISGLLDQLALTMLDLSVAKTRLAQVNNTISDLHAEVVLTRSRPHG